MASIIISKIKLRRGTRDQIKTVIYDQGEPIYSIDTNRLYIGTSTLSGGTAIGAKVHTPITSYYNLSDVVAEIGDLVEANNKFYQLTASSYTNLNSWRDVSVKIDSRVFRYDTSNNLAIKANSLSASLLKSDDLGGGIIIESGLLKVDHTTKSLEISGDQLSIKAGGIDQREIASTTLSSGLSGGNGDQISVLLDPNYLSFNGSNQITIDSIPFGSLDSNWEGFGISINPATETISAYVANIDSTMSRNSASGTVGQAVVNSAWSTPSTRQWGQYTLDQYGRVLSADSSIYDVLTGNNGGGFTTFNGDPTNPLSAYGGGTLTVISALSSNGATVSLSSAGFLVLESGITTRNGSKTVPRFAIPIYRF